MPAWTVTRRGTDTSGRGIYASDYMWSVWLMVLAHPDVKPFAHKIVITQGAWMTLAGGGASASAGYHDGGGCFDLRVWNLTTAEIRTLIRVLRLHGIAAWLRNEAHGGFSDPHIHLVLGTDYDLDDGAAYQWRSYIAGGDGMGGSDYHPRPHPLVTTPPEDDMADYAEQLDRIEKKVDRLADKERLRNTKQRERDKALAAELGEIAETVADAAKAKALRAARDRILAELAEDEPEPDPT